MNVFVLCTGRCGSKTFAEACRHISNYRSGHETRVNRVGRRRCAYPRNHIEIDNRLSWMLGRLDRTFGRRAFHIHLTRDPDDVAQSYARRKFGIAQAYQRDVVFGAPAATYLESCRDMVNTVTQNIKMFLRDKPLWMPFALETVDKDFPVFWEKIKAKGDYRAAVAEFEIRHNSSLSLGI